MERPMSTFATNTIEQTCFRPRAIGLSAAALSRDYCLHDLAGRILGTIAAPARRPEVGPAAPTFYLRRIS
jgi:hypothetical protein